MPAITHVTFNGKINVTVAFDLDWEIGQEFVEDGEDTETMRVLDASFSRFEVALRTDSAPDPEFFRKLAGKLGLAVTIIVEGFNDDDPIALSTSYDDQGVLTAVAEAGFIHHRVVGGIILDTPVVELAHIANSPTKYPAATIREALRELMTRVGLPTANIRA